MTENRVPMSRFFLAANTRSSPLLHRLRSRLTPRSGRRRHLKGRALPSPCGVATAPWPSAVPLSRPSWQGKAAEKAGVKAETAQRTVDACHERPGSADKTAFRASQLPYLIVTPHV